MTTLTSTIRRRSRGCNTCRKRRVKCDETPQYCKQCLRLGLECTGLLEGALVIDMTVPVSENQRPNQRSNMLDPQPSAPLCEALTTYQPAAETSAPESFDAIAWLASLAPYEAPLPFDPLPVWLPSNEVLRMAQVMCLSTPGRVGGGAMGPWILSEPEQLSCSKLPSFQPSIQAVKAAFHGFLNHDRSASEASCRFYVDSLGAHRKYLTNAMTGLNITSIGKKIPGIADILVPMFLCLFEVITCTTSKGCFQHLNAASLLIQLRGPENCQIGIVHQIFRTLRVSDACVALYKGRISCFASEEWRVIPFIGYEKPPLHYLINILLQVPSAMGVNEGEEIPLPEQFVRLSLSSEARRDLVRQRCLALLDLLSEWWLGFERNNYIATTGKENLAVPQFAPSAFIFKDSFTAFAVSLYDAASLVLHYTLHFVRPSSAESHLLQAASHSTSILLISEFQQQKCVVGFDLIRSTFALSAVEAIGPSAEIKQRAKMMCDNWVERGVGGILSVP